MLCFGPQRLAAFPWRIADGMNADGFFEERRDQQIRWAFIEKPSTAIHDQSIRPVSP